MLNWSLSPIYNRMDYLGMDAMFYDPAAAQWNKASGTGAQQGASPDSGSQAVLKDRNKQANQANAQSQASANATEAGMLRGGGTIELDGCPEAVVGAVCNVQGTRPGIDGSYLIYQVQHTFVRGKGFTTSLVVMQPQALNETEAAAVSGGMMRTTIAMARAEGITRFRVLVREATRMLS